MASVGEDVQGRVQCLTEDKARMATMIRKYSERVDRDYEEKERIGIQCDVWRSKFLGSRWVMEIFRYPCYCRVCKFVITFCFSLRITLRIQSRSSLFEGDGKFMLLY